MRISLLSFLVLSGLVCTAQDKSPVDYVSTLVGTASTMPLSNGNTYPAMCLPFAINTWGPQTGSNNDRFQYQYEKNYIRGFRQSRQPSLWVGDYGQFSIMPVTSRTRFSENDRQSWHSHKEEIATPYYYSGYMADAHTRVEMTPTEHAAMFRFRFHEADSAFLVIDAFTGGSFVKIIPEKNMVIGYSVKGCSAPNFRNYFVFKFDKPFSNTAVWQEKVLATDRLETSGKHSGAIVGFDLKPGEKVIAEVASSFISPEQAEHNLKEIGGRSFEEVKADAKAIWNRELGRIEIEGATEEQLRTFYSALYRTMIFPRRFREVDPAGNIVHYSPFTGKTEPGSIFTDNGYWDTFRAQIPLVTLLQPSLTAQILKGMENTYKESGWLPEWLSPGHRNCMIGSHSAAVIADSYLKGVRGEFDINVLYEGILKNSSDNHPSISSVGRKGYKEYNTLGYIPYDVNINQNVSRTLEYAYDDYTIYALSKALGRPEAESETFLSRSQNYRNLYDPQTRLMRPRGKDGKFQPGFDPFRWGDHFTEATSWHYTWSVMHDPQGLINLMGGNEQFTAKLDSIFTLPPIFDISYYKRGIIHLVREMQGADMGQYAHNNEPMHHVAYLYSYAGQPWKTQYHVREIMNRLYNPNPDGYCGDEDNGQMSAWYVFSAMGFYPVCPGSNQYVFGAPLFKKVTIHLENGNKVVINAPDNSSENRYIGSMTVNGKPYTHNWIDHKTLSDGVAIDIKMTDTPNTMRGTSYDDAPYSVSKPTDK